MSTPHSGSKRRVIYRRPEWGAVPFQWDLIGTEQDARDAAAWLGSMGYEVVSVEQPTGAAPVPGAGVQTDGQEARI